MKDERKDFEENVEEENVRDADTVGNNTANGDNELETLKAQMDEKSKRCDEYFAMLQRAAAEFDNYKKRTAREKDALYSEALSDCVLVFLPVIDNLERALQASNNEEDGKSLKEGIELVYRQFRDAMKKLGIEEIKSVGEEFNPELHNAVMHMTDDSYGSNTVAEEFQKGYMMKDKVIRHSMVKVAN